jgi:hypothetical protein
MSKMINRMINFYKKRENMRVSMKEKERSWKAKEKRKMNCKGKVRII